MQGPPYSETVKSSRFIGLSQHLGDESELAVVLATAHADWPDAAHYTWAYRIAPGRERASDDGEPHASAGLPMLHIIQNRDLIQTLVLVVRYFGGTKLGRGGLTRTYREVCARTLELADIVDLVPMYHLRLVLDYAQYEFISHRLGEHAIVATTTFLEAVTLDFFCEVTTWDAMALDIRPRVLSLEQDEPRLRPNPPA